MKNKEGNLTTGRQEILAETVSHYKSVLENRPIKENLKTHRDEREKLAKLRMKKSRKNTTPDWDMEDVHEALKGLKNNKSCDAFGFTNELYKPGVIGTDLQMSLLQFMNKIKRDQVFPHCL